MKPKEINLQNHPWSTLDSSLEKGRYLISPRTGIINSIIPICVDDDDPDVHCMAVKSCITGIFSNHPAKLKCGGAGITVEESMTAAVGETVERYCASFLNPDDMEFGCYIDFKEDAVPPGRFKFYSQNQYAGPNFPFIPFTEESRIKWVWGYSLLSKQPRLVPAFIVYLSNHTEQQYGQIVSTGLACGNNLEEAVLRGLYEVVERDSFINLWMNRLPMPRIDPLTLQPPDGLNYRELFHMDHIRHSLWNITTDTNIPVILTLAIGPSKLGDIVTIGASCDLDPGRGVRKSLVEAAHGRSYIKYLMRNPWKCKELSDLRSFEDHAQFYTRHPEHMNAFDFLFNSPSVVPFNSIKNLSSEDVSDDIQTCLDHLKNIVSDVIAVDVTTSDIESVGYKVIRVIIPELLQLHGDYRYPFLGNPRLYELPRVLGFADQPVTEAQLNPFPHPFP